MLITRIVRYMYARKLEKQCVSYAAYLRMACVDKGNTCWESWNYYNKIVRVLDEPKAGKFYWFIRVHQYVALTELRWRFLQDVANELNGVSYKYNVSA